MSKDIFTVARTINRILCCKCSISMEPNAANMCKKCLQSEVDITDCLERHVVIIPCSVCDSYLSPRGPYTKAPLESRELMEFCIKKLSLQRLRLVRSEFIWTEPHSKKIKLKLSVCKNHHGLVIEQSHIVEYVIHDQMCLCCLRIEADPDQFVAAVQVRQRVSHTRTFLFLEQLILRHDAARYAVGIKPVRNGVDFFFKKPISLGDHRQFLSHDEFRYTTTVEISPICREDLICLPHKVAASLGNLGPIVICHKVSSSIGLFDVINLREKFLDAAEYWRSSFRALLTSRQLVKFVVLYVEDVDSEVVVGGVRYASAWVRVARESDFGKNFRVRTHLGHVLKCGEYALGYDLHGANVNDVELDKFGMPDVVLIRKIYEEREKVRNEQALREKNLKMFSNLCLNSDEENLQPEMDFDGGDFFTKFVGLNLACEEGDLGGDGMELE